jgi:uncharacterized protein (TIGR00255 family)
MMQSMTGFGKAQSDLEGKKLTVEIRSLNSKQLDLNLRLSTAYRAKELELRSELAKTLERGKVDVAIYTELSSADNSTNTLSINKDIAKAYYHELKQLATELDANQQSLLEMVIKMPEVLKNEKETTLDDTEWNQVKQTVNNALQAFQQFRKDEGKVLATEFETRINNIEQHLNQVLNMDSERITRIKTRIKNNLEEVIDSTKIDQNRFEQELIYYIEKLDITEEKLRLQTHLNYFKTTMKEAAAGRKLGFITQEIGREINTIGSKANDAEMQKCVVQMKDELEKIKEQLLNVL